MARITTNVALLIDAAGCFAGACLFLISSTAWGWLDLPGSWRLPVVVGLFASSVYLVIAARYRHRTFIALAVILNIAWITAGAFALFVTGTLLGGVIIALVILADAVMAWLQARGLTQIQEEPVVQSPTLERIQESGP